ncbi:MAG TPA: hypothetical protein VMH49_02565 [Thermoplasmata archaeon]|nr:hypothetical protein [Thermoplasmata archaeon]
MARNTRRESERDDARPLVLLWSETARKRATPLRITSIFEGGSEGAYTY